MKRQIVKSSVSTADTSDGGSSDETIEHREIPQLLERRSLMSCLDWPGTIHTLWNFDWNRFVPRSFCILFGLHIVALIGLLQLIKGEVLWQTLLYNWINHILAAFGVTAGMHRYWSHKTYKAARPVQYVLMVMATMASQNSIFEWCRDHRVHHKHSETAADPHNAVKGFFFSHVGWLFVRKDKQVIEMGKKLSVKDLENDPMVMWQHRNYLKLVLLLSVIVPSIVPLIAWNESLWSAYCTAILRVVFTLHVTWCVNSLAHWWGDTPYDATIYPVENYIVSWLTCGEGFHNYHHTYPNDYRASDRVDPFLARLFLNPTQVLIDSLGLLRLAWGRVKIPKHIVKAKISSHGRAALEAMTVKQ